MRPVQSMKYSHTKKSGGQGVFPLPAGSVSDGQPAGSMCRLQWSPSASFTSVAR